MSFRNISRIRVLYSFPHKLGASRICHTAWNQVVGVAAAGADVMACPGALHKAVPGTVVVKPTLAWGRIRLPYRLIGSRRAWGLHDYLISRRIERLVGQVDIIHAWPSGALRTLKTAARLGIPTVLERPNAHTRYAYEVVKRECERLGITLASNHEHAFNAAVLRKEEEEFRLASRLLCPSDFVVRTFLDLGFAEERLARHQYGFDESSFFPKGQRRESGGLNMLFAGACNPRKGLHYALEAWLQSPAHKSGQFLIAGAFVPGYAEKLSSLISHPSIRVLGHRSDLPELMNQSDVFILPSIEEGSALVTSEARGSGCVLLVSEASGAYCEHMENALVHRVGDTKALTQHITMLHENPALLKQLRANSLRTVHELTWKAAGARLLQVYRDVVQKHGDSSN